MANVLSSEGAFEFPSIATSRIEFGDSVEITCNSLIFSDSISKKKVDKESCNQRTLKHGHILFFVLLVKHYNIS